MATNYKQMLVDLAPPFLRNPQGEAWLRASGDSMDSLLDATKEAVKARFPIGAPRDALTLLGGERGILRAQGETDASYAERVAGAWDVWPWAGTAYGVLNVLWDAGYSTYPRILIAKGLIYSLDAGRNLVIEETPPGLFTFDPPGHWATFMVLFTLPHPPQWSGGVPAHGSDEALFVISLIQRWKSAHAKLQNVVIEGTGELWGWPPEGLWSDPGVWGGTSTVWTP